LAPRSNPIDWEAARARLTAAQERLAASDEPSADTLREILHARAQTLATPKVVAPPVEIVELVVFRLGDRRYAIVAGEALESITISETTVLPGVPNVYRGLISHRGIIYPLVDVRPLIGGALDGVAQPAQAMLFLSEAATAALVADEVEAFVRIDAATIAAAGSANGIEPSAAIRGVTPDAIVVLDIWVLLADARLVVDERSARG
jgi:chemotaxis signal transduction protein